MLDAKSSFKNPFLDSPWLDLMEETASSERAKPSIQPQPRAERSSSGGGAGRTSAKYLKDVMDAAGQMAGDAPMPTTVANEPTVSGAATEAAEAPPKAAEAPPQYLTKDGPQPQAHSETAKILEGTGKAMKELPADETKSYYDRLGDALSYSHDNTLRHLSGAQWVMGGGDSDELAGRIADGMKAATQRQGQRTDGQKKLDASFEGVDKAEGFWETTQAVGDVIGTAVTEPGAVLLGSAESAASMMPSLAGGAAGAGLGAGVGAGAGSLLGGVGALPGAATGAGVGFYTGSALGTTATEMGAELEQMVGEKLQDAGKEPTKENIKAVLDDKGFQEEAMGRGLKKGLTLAAIDALTMKLGGKIATAPMRAAEKKAVTELAQTAGVDEKAARAMLNTPAGKAALEAAKPGMKARTGAALGGVGVELAGEPVGEAASQAVARDEVDWSDVAAEGVYGAGTSVVGAGMGGGIEALKMAAARRRNQQNAGKTAPQPRAGNAAAAQPSAGSTVPPSAPGPQPMAPQPSGPLSRAVVNTEDQIAKAAQAQPEVVTVTGPNGQTVPGFLAGYQEDGQGGFAARVLGADGQTYQFTDQDGVTIQRQGQPAAGQAPDDQQQQAPSDQQQDTKQASARPDFDSMLFNDVVVEVDGEALTAKLIDVNEDGVTIRDQSGQTGFFELADFDDGIVSIRGADMPKVAAPEPVTGTESQSTAEIPQENPADQGDINEQQGALVTDEQGAAPQPAAEPINQAPVKNAEPATPEVAPTEPAASQEPQAIEQPVVKPTKAEEPAPQQQPTQEILGKDGQRKWFGSKPKAMEFIASKGLGDTHEIRKSGPKWEIHTKSQAATQPAQQTESDRPAPSVSGETVTAPVQAEASPSKQETPASQPAKTPEKAQTPGKVTEQASEEAAPEEHRTPAQRKKEQAQRNIDRSAEAIGAQKGDQVQITGEVGYAGNNIYTIEDIDSKGNVYLKSDSGRTSISPAEIQGAKLRGTTFTRVEGKPAPAQSPVPKAKKKPAPEASANKVFTEDAAEKARALLRSKLGQVNSGVDPEVLQAGIVLSGYHIEKGARTFAAYAKAMLEDLGEVARPYLKSWYLGAKFDPRAAGFDGLSPAAEVESFNVDEVELDVPSTAPVLERDDALPENAVGEAVGATQGSGSLRGSERAVDAAVARGRVRPVDGSGVPATSPLDAGTPGDQRIPAQDRQPGSETGVARTSDPRGNRRDGRVGIQSGRRADTRLREKTQKRSEELTRRQKQQAVADQLPVTLLDPDNIKATLPLLSEHQQLDVFKAERRLYQDGGKGILLTNGTGTGKTYSGLGLIKRVIRRGGDVLIVSPAGVISAWEKGAKDLGLTPARLKSKRDAGKPGLSITSYQNFRDNQELMRRNFDLVVYDESHHLMSNMGGDSTSASLAHKAMTGHPDYERTRGSLALKSEFDAYVADVEAEVTKLTDKGVDRAMAEQQVYNQPKIKQRYEALTKQAADLSDKLAAEQKEKNTKVLFLSASPFAGHKSVFYTDGYLFESKVGAKDSQAYNTGSPESQYLVTNFGYRMRYNRVTQPGPEVDVGLLERDWADRMFQTGAMSGRKIELDHDYSREFVTVAPGVGAQIDKAFETINWKDYPKLAQQLIDWRKGGSDRQLTEALRTKASLDRIAKHLAMGRKVVVFHERQQLNIQNPFHFKTPDEETKAEIAKLKAAQPWIFDIDLGGLQPAPTAIGNRFGDRVGFFSGLNKSARDKDLAEFNLDGGGKDILVIQKDAGKEGLSAHDVTGKHPRALMIMNTPVSPADAIQMEGRTYRHGLRSDAIIEYPTIQTSFEKTAYRETVSTRTSTAENLAMGSQARNLRESFREGYLDPATEAPNAKQGIGGRKADSTNDGLSLFDRAKTYYFRRQKKTSKNKAAEGADYFATPEPLGMKMVEWAKLEAGEKALEPSGGHGAIARWLPESSTNLALEPSPDLVGELGIVTSGDVRQMRFEDLNIVNKFHAVVMNPPFGKGGATAIEHIGKAVEHLKDGGRVIAIYPKGTAADAKFEKWFEGKRGVYLTASIDLPAVTFNRAGTSVATRILVLDKDTRGNNVSQGMVKRDLSGITNINELFQRIENMDLPARPDVTVTGRDVNLAESQLKDKGGQDVWRATMTEFTNHGPAKEVGLRDVKKLAEKFNGEVVNDNSRIWKTTHFDFASEQERERFFAGVLDASEARKQGGVRFSQERAPEQKGLTVDEAKRVVDDFLREYNYHIPLEPFIRQTAEEIYGSEVAAELGEGYRGGYHPAEQVFAIVAGNARERVLAGHEGVSGGENGLTENKGQEATAEMGGRATAEADLLTTLRHELLGHYGLDTFTPEDKARLLQKLIDARNEPWLEPYWADIESDPFYGAKDEQHRAEEVYAHIAQEQSLPQATQAENDEKTDALSLLREDGSAKGRLITEHELDSLIRAVAEGIRDGSRILQNFRQNDEVIGEPGFVAGQAGKPERLVRFSALGQTRGKAPAKHMSKAEVEAQVMKWLEKYHGVSLDNIQIHETQAQLEAALGQDPKEGLIRRAAYDEESNTLHVVAENVRDNQHLLTLLRHEVIAHYGLAKAIGGGEFTRLIARIIGSKNDPAMKEAWDWVEKNYKNSPVSEQAEEVIAHLAELEPSAWTGAWDRIASWLMGALRRSGFMRAGLISKAELRNVLAGLDRKLQGREQGQRKPRAEKRFNHVREAKEFTPFAASETNATGIPLDELKRVVEDMKASYNGNIPLDIRAVDKVEDAYGPNISDGERRVKGAYHPRARVAVLAAANLRNIQDARDTFRHEILGHYGLNTFTPEDKKALLRKISETRNAKSLRPYWDRVDRDYKGSTEGIKAEEVFAAIAQEENTYKDPTWREKVLNFLNGLLRKIGLTKRPLTLPELRDTARAISRGIRSGERVQQTFPKDDDSQYSLSPKEGEAIVKAATQGIELEQARDRDQLGSVIADQGKLSRWFVHPRTIAAVHPEFTPVYKTAISQMETRDANVEELGQHLKQYNDLPQEGKVRVNQALELGRLLGDVFTKVQLENGIDVPATKQEGGVDSEGNPQLNMVPITPLLSKAGDSIKLSSEEARAYRSLRTMFNKALDKFRDQVLEEYGFPELVGTANAGKEILGLIDKDTPQAKLEALTNMGNFISEIEQAKRTGYVPFARYGDYVVTVKEKVADLEFVEDSTDAYIVKGVTDEIAPRVAELGGVFVKAENGWRIPKSMRQEVKRLGEKTVYSEMVEPGITGKFYERWADNVADIPEVKKAIERVRKEWVGDNADRRIVSFKPRDKKPTDPVSLTDVDALASVANIDNATWDAIRDKLSDAIKGQSFRRHFFQSSNVPGYTGDFERAMSDYVIGMSGYLSRRGHMKRWDRAVSGITDKAQLFDYASTYREYVNNPQEEFAMTRQIGFLWYIAGVTATAIANLTQVPLLTVPTLAQIAPTALVLKEIGRAYKDALAMARPHKSGLDIFDPEKAPADVRDILKKAWAEGVFVPLETYELMTIARQRNTGNRKAARTFNNGLQGLSYLFTFAERLNRLVTYIAAARLASKPAVKAKAQNVLKDDALAKSSVLGRNWSPESLAEWAVDESQYRMGKANRPTAMRGVGAALMQFKSYIIQTFEAWYRMGALHDKRGKYALASSLALLLATSGIWGAPGADDLRELVEEIYRRITGKDLDMRTELRGWIMRNSGSQYIANAVNRGIPYASIGMDMSGRVGMGGIKPDRAIDVLGPTVGIGSKAIEGVGKMAAGDVSGGLLNMLPNFIKHPLTATQWNDSGLRDKYGKTILPAEGLTSTDLMMKVMGFQPAIATDVRDYDYAQSRQQSAQDDLKRRFSSELARSLASAERADTDDERIEAEAQVADVLQRLQEHNEGVSDPSEAIKLSRPSIAGRVAQELYGWEAGNGRERKQSRAAAAKLREEYGLSDVLAD